MEDLTWVFGNLPFAPWVYNFGFLPKIMWLDKLREKSGFLNCRQFIFFLFQAKECVSGIIQRRFSVKTTIWSKLFDLMHMDVAFLTRFQISEIMFWYASSHVDLLMRAKYILYPIIKIRRNPKTSRHFPRIINTTYFILTGATLESIYC